MFFNSFAWFYISLHKLSAYFTNRAVLQHAEMNGLTMFLFTGIYKAFWKRNIYILSSLQLKKTFAQKI